jgi:hypothetical protein
MGCSGPFGGRSRHTLAVTGRAAVGHGLGGEKSGSRSGLGALRLAPGDFLGAPRRREAMRRRITRGRCSRPARGTDPGRRGSSALADSVSPPLVSASWAVHFRLMARLVPYRPSDRYLWGFFCFMARGRSSFVGILGFGCGCPKLGLWSSGRSVRETSGQSL